MATSSNTLLITTPGLKKVSRELLDKRVFVSSKITEVGTPIVSDTGIASGFTPLVTGETVPSYFMKDNLSFTNSDNLKIIVEGKFVPKTDDVPACLWSLTGTNVDSLNIEVCSDKVQLWLGNATIASITDVAISENDKIKIELNCATTGCTITAIIGGEDLYTKTVTFSEAITFTSYTSVLIGVKDAIGTNYWQGNIDLPTFCIYKDTELYYSPSIDNIFKFTKILVCDASVTLTDTSEEIINHCYELSIYELKRSFNTILITAQIPSDAYLNLNKIGLYSTGDDGDQLFALIDNLMIKKTKGLEYNLVLNISLDLNVVNTLVMPDFVLNEVINTKYTDFDNIKKKFTLAEVDLERMIKTNAREVGYKKPQVNYRLEDNIELIEDNYMAVRDFLRMTDNFQVIEKDVFDYTKAVVYEPLTIQDSIATGFTTSNYLTPQYMAIGGNDIWEFVAPFITTSDVSTTQSIVSAFSCNSNIPFRVYISNGYCKAKISKPETISFTLVSDPTQTITYIRNSEKTTMSGTEYYFWTNRDATIDIVYTTAKNPTSASNFYYLDDGTITPVSTLTFSGYSKAVLIDKSIFAVEPFTKYYFKVGYDGTSYKFYKSMDGEEYTIVDTENISTEMATSNNICVGVLYSESSIVYPFLGGIDLSGLYLNKQSTETTGMILKNSSLQEFTYDKTGEIYYGWSYTSGSSTYVVYVKTLTLTPTTPMYNIDGTLYTGSDFTIALPTGQTNYVIQYQGHNTSRSASYYTWTADSSSYSIQTVYTQDPDPAAASRLFKLSGSSLVSLTELTFKELITITVANITSMTKTEVVNDSVLKDYFHIPTYDYSSYRVINLCNSNSKLEVLDCSFTGNKIDNIDFSGINGFTLCTKVSLSELYDELEAEPSTSAASRTILAKTSLGSTHYLNVSLACNADKSIFTLSASIANGSFTISNEISMYDIGKYVDNPILLTLTFDANSSDRLLKLYKNNDLVSSLLIPIGTTITAPASTDMITNYLTTAEMAYANSCVSDIVFINGPVDESQLYYTTNLLDCNF